MYSTVLELYFWHSIYTEEYFSFTWNRRNSELGKTERTVSFLTVLEVVAWCTCCFTYCTRATKHTATDQARTIVSYHQNIAIRFATQREGTQHPC